MPQPAPPQAAPALDIVSLRKSYGGKAVLAGMTFRAERGELTAVLGPNGAGKTTTIECAENLRQPDSGDIRVLGHLPSDPSLRYHVGVMLQDGGLPTGVKSLELLRHVAAMYPNPRPVGDLADRLGIHSFATTSVRRLSGGQRQRLALAAALVGSPQLVFLDEPSAGLDPQSRQAVWSLIRELRDESVSFVLTTHLMDEAASLADHVVIVDHGRVIASGSVAELTGSPGPGAGHSTIRWETTPGLDLTGLDVTLGNADRAHGAGDAWELCETRPGCYVATGPVTPATLTALTAWLERRESLLGNLSVNRRGLEDVFLDLTGRNLR
ncbi:ABC transporter ATP-binding protein [Rarobacter faecitabidus]|uniref:ABC-2 type transport system ATP-binding protein n=1 Tax=Rarobacter faecitabidus TaxID=13243 RepID=A0A542ZVA4_RARFA|nr:ABC transporter ATP-binding protein [Rarobacter faecitabidus]TQL64295.1 ABC-2 type transport system ATP-binding protein [Rarobacter faecitabidus]